MNNILANIRNRFEASNKVAKYGDYLINSRIYQLLINSIARMRIKRINKSKSYLFAIEVSSFCNAKCMFCPNVSMKRKKSVMTMEIFNKIVERIKEEKIIPTQFNLTGTGEPLTDKYIFKKVEILKTNFPNALVYFPTNLALADKNIINKIINSRLDNVGISLNANTAAEYKKIMHLDFDRTLKNLEDLIKLRKMKQSKLKIYLTIAANPINKSSVGEFIKTWEKRIDGVAVNWIHDWAGAVKTGKVKENQKRFPCRLLFEQIVIQSNGNVPLCCIDYEGSIIGGNIMKKSIMKSYYADNINKIRKLHLTDRIGRIRMCSQCRFSERGLYWLV